MNEAYRASTALGLFLALASGVGCSDKQAGEIMIGISTNMSLPKDVSAIRIQVIAHGEHLHDKVYNVGPGEDREKLPGSLAVVQGEDASAPVTMKVIALQGPERKARVVAKAISTIPSERVALLSLPIDWLCDDTARSTGDAIDPDYESTCGDGKVCVAGACVSTTIDSSTLGDYEPGKLFGGGTGKGDGTCFDTQPCFVEAAEPTLSTVDCTFDAPAGSLNVAVRAASDGICGPSGCLIPLDQSDTGAGWRVSGGKVHLPAKVCELVQSGKALGVAVSTACATKTSATPTCGPWSSVGGGGGSGGAGGTGGGGTTITSGTGGTGGGSTTSDTGGAGGTGGGGTTSGNTTSGTGGTGGGNTTSGTGGTGGGGTTSSESCSPEAVQCGGSEGQTPQICDQSGQWQGDTLCSAGNYCSAGGCFGVNAWANWSMPSPVGAGEANEVSYDTSIPGVVKDTVTGLSWQQSVDAQTYTWADATTYCEDLSLAGSDDWRLPTRIELLSIVDFTRSAPAIDATAFPNTPAEFFWSSSPVAGNANNAWYVNFYFGSSRDNGDVDGTGRVRCVR